jgi:antitoxin HicB
MTTLPPIDELLKRPYRKVIRGTAEDGYLAEAPELPGCVTAGDTEAEALELLADAMAGWCDARLARGLPIPEPSSSEAPS